MSQVTLIARLAQGDNVVAAARNPRSIAKVRKPKTDPVLGAGGPLLRHWRPHSSRS
ncbi:uncharacterized protein YjlB [Bradyrhizobium liaoningense]|uniref:hypothetical protein n=1 Tax=Bradyrhizobium liaoningense TaxID=43992 RepID=UPI0004B045D7|nr:hypothetical protein [Bradyrhizobium liaoningense]